MGKIEELVKELANAYIERIKEVSAKLKEKHILPVPRIC